MVRRYWEAIQRCVLLGWTEDARDLLFVHSDLQDAEEGMSQQTKVWVVMFTLCVAFTAMCVCYACLAKRQLVAVSSSLQKELASAHAHAAQLRCSSHKSFVSCLTFSKALSVVMLSPTPWQALFA